MARAKGIEREGGPSVNPDMILQCQTETGSVPGRGGVSTGRGATA